MGGISLNMEIGTVAGATTSHLPSQHVDLPAAETPVEAPRPEPQAAASQPIIVETPDLQASFVYDKELNRVIITLIREGTGEVVRQIPSEQLSRCLAGMLEMAGKVFDGKA